MIGVWHEIGIFAFIIPSPKQRDLHRDGRYAMHSYPREDDEDAFFVAGRAPTSKTRKFTMLSAISS